MRLTLPERVPIAYAGLFAGLLFTLQVLEGTGLYFASSSFLFILCATVSFNIAGGLTRPSGGYIFFFSVLAGIVGLVAKAVLGQPGDSNLLQPRLTITVYLVGVLGMGAAAYLSRRLSFKRPLLAGMLTEARMLPATIGCLVFGVFLTIATFTVERGSGTAWSALIQMNRFGELAIILNVFDTARKSGGRKSLTTPGYIAAGVLFIVDGILAFSKEGMFTPIVCWFLAGCAVQLSLSRLQLIGSLLGLFFVSHFLVPYSQYGRTQTGGNIVANLSVSTRLLSSLPEVRDIYVAQSKQEAEQGLGGYFNAPVGILDRLQMLGPDDMLIDATVHQGPYGYFPILADLEALIPHIFWPNKPNFLWGNIYAHQAGVNISEDDFSTGISFSPVGEGYHLGEWTGVLLLCPLIWFCSFWIFDSIGGDVRDSPWSLLILVYFGHVAPEGYLGGLIYASFYVSVAIIFAALAIGFVMPVVGSLFLGRRSTLGTPIGFGPAPAGTAPAAAANDLHL